MSNTGGSIKWNPIREIAAGALTGSYQVLGGVLQQDSFRIWVTNATNGDIYFSKDGVNNMLKLPAMSGRAYDNKTNDAFLLQGTQWYIKFAAVPGAPAGWAAIEVEYV